MGTHGEIDLITYHIKNRGFTTELHPAPTYAYIHKHELDQ